eukprot:5871410-Lingulodinium_polyedra.AAC.1
MLSFFRFFWEYGHARTARADDGRATTSCGPLLEVAYRLCGIYPTIERRYRLRPSSLPALASPTA